MIVACLELLAIALTALVFGVYWGPWIALTRTIAALPADVFLEVVHRLDRNLAPLMTVLMPVTLASFVPVLILDWQEPLRFAVVTTAFALLIVTTIVTMTTEVPIVAQVRMWTPDTLPSDWTERRDRWTSWHWVRVIGGFLSLILLVAAAIF